MLLDIIKKVFLTNFYDFGIYFPRVCYLLSYTFWNTCHER